MMYFTSSSLSSGRAGEPYEGRINVTGNLGPQRFSILEGQLPPGLEIARDTGWIHGTPEADGGYYGFTVAVADPRGTISRDFEIRILAATGAKSVSRSPSLGFNGERLDPVTGMTHLGNGYRAYNPVLMRFNCPDSLSPFGAGGINPYAYCAGDPINRADPSGHLSWQAIAGIALGIIGLGAALFTAGTSIAAAGGVIAALEAASTSSLVTGGLGAAADLTGIIGSVTDNQKVSDMLGWVSFGLGVAGVLQSVGTALARRATASLRATLGNIRETGLSGRGAAGRSAFTTRLGNKRLKLAPKELIEESAKNKISELLRQKSSLQYLKEAHLDPYVIQRAAGDDEIFALRRNGDGYSLISMEIQPKTIVAHGTYEFVILPENPYEILCARSRNYVEFDFGHTSITRGEPVIFAGDADFKMGALSHWNNRSGHYKLKSSLAQTQLLPWVKHLLPMDRYKPIA